MPAYDTKMQFTHTFCWTVQVWKTPGSVLTWHVRVPVSAPTTHCAFAHVSQGDAYRYTMGLVYPSLMVPEMDCVWPASSCQSEVPFRLMYSVSSIGVLYGGVPAPA